MTQFLDEKCSVDSALKVRHILADDDSQIEAEAAAYKSLSLPQLH